MAIEWEEQSFQPVNAPGAAPSAVPNSTPAPASKRTIEWEADSATPAPGAPDRSMADIATDVMSDAWGEISSGANELNRGILMSVGAPDLLAGLGIGENVARGDDGKPTWVQGGMRMTGMAMGTTFQAMLPVALAAKGLTYAQVMLQRSLDAIKGGINATTMTFLNETAETALRRPAAIASIEAGTAFASGAAGQSVYNETGSEKDRLVTEMLTAVAPASAFYTARQIAKHSPAFQMGRSAIRSVSQRVRSKLSGNGFTVPPASEDPVALDMAKKRVQAVASDPVEAARKADQANVIPGVGYAARSEDQGLLSLEAAVMKSSEKLSEKSKQQFAQINRSAREEVMNLAPSDSKMDDAREYMRAVLDDRIRIAGLATQERLEAMAPINLREDANTIATSELRSAYRDSGLQQEALWLNVDMSIQGEPRGTAQLYDNLIETVGGNRALLNSFNEDMPIFIRKALGGFDKEGNFVPGNFGESVSIGELKELRTQTLTAARAERALDAPNGTKLRYLGEIEDSILSDMNRYGDDEALTLARNYTADHKRRFRQGVVGQLLGIERTGASRVPDNMTLEKVLTGTGIGPAAKVDQLMEAFSRQGDPDRMRGLVQDVLLDEFNRHTILDGDFSVRKAQSYLKKRADVLNRFPEARARMERSIASGKRETDILTAPDFAIASLILKKPAGKEVSAILNSPEPGLAAAETMRLLSTPFPGDNTGIGPEEAVNGFRRAFIDELLTRSTNPDIVDTSGMAILYGPRLNNVLQDRGVNQAVQQVFTPVQRQHLERVRNSVMLQHQQSVASPTQDTLAASENFYAKMARKFMGAAMGRRIGAATGSNATVQAPSFGVSMTEYWVERGLDPGRAVIMDAILSGDDTLMRALLTEPASEKIAQQQGRRLQAWFWGSVERYGASLADLAPTEEEQAKAAEEKNKAVLEFMDQVLAPPQ